jgi:hypothetical protein
MANSVESNQRRRRREPPAVDWDQAIANLLDILDDHLRQAGVGAPVEALSLV